MYVESLAAPAPALSLRSAITTGPTGWRSASSMASVTPRPLHVWPLTMFRKLEATSSRTLSASDSSLSVADKVLEEVASSFLNIVSGHTWSGLGVTEAIDEALRQPVGPVVIADRSDNAGAGAASDSTYILAELIERGVTNATLGMIWDPMAVRVCHDAGVGAKLPMRIGGKAGRLSGTPIDADVEVIS